MSDISKQTQDIIKEKGISPIPSWRFTLKEILVWLGAVCVLILGSLVTSLALYQLFDVNWQFFRQRIPGLLERILILIPFVWIIIACLSVYLIVKSVHSTKDGYKISSPIILAISFTISLITGAIIYSSGGSQIIDRELAERSIFYFHNLSMERGWRFPEQGFLAGRITEVVSSEEIEVEDLARIVWFVNVEEAEWIAPATPREGIMVKIIGEVTNNDTKSFSAEQILPSGPSRGLPVQGRPHLMMQVPRAEY